MASNFARLTPGQHTVDVDGVRVSYHVAGRGPVCLVHPGGPGFSWHYMRMPAVEEHLTTVYIEPIGTGDSGRLPTHPHGYTRHWHTRTVAAVLDHLELPKAHLLGHSHGGGFVAQHCAVHLPHRLAGVVLYASAPAVDQAHVAEATRNLTQFARRNSGHPGVAAAVLAAWRSIPTISRDEDVVRISRALLPACFADFWGHSRDFTASAQDVTGSYISGLDEHGVPQPMDDRRVLGSITVDTLVLAGRHDFLCGPRWAEELHKLIPGSGLTIFEQSGHVAHVEQPAEFAKAVVDFVRGKGSRHG